MNKLFYTTIIPLFFFLNIFNSFSREVKKDTLKLKKELKTYNYNQLDSLYIDANRKIDSIRMYAIAGQMLEKAKQENKSQYYIRGYQFLSITDRMLGKYKKSLKHINRAVFYIEETGKYDRKDRIYLSKGAVHQDLGEYDLALDSYIKGLSYVGEEKRTTKISFYHNIASLKSFLFDAQGALEDYLKILKLIEEDKNEEYNSKEINRLFCLNQIARVHIDLGNYQQALTYCNEVIKNREFIEKKENLNNRAILVEAYLGFGNIYSLTGFYKKALSYLEEANKLNNTVNTDYLKVFIHFFKARTFFFLENYKEAISQLKIVESINDKNNFNHLYLEEMNILFAKSYQKQGDLKIATDYFNKSLKTIKNNEKRKIRLNNNILKKYDLSTLSKDLAIAELKLKKQKRYVKTFLTIFLITLLTSLGSYIHVRIKNKRRFNNLMTEFYFSNIRTDTKKMELIDKVGSVEIKKILDQLKDFENDKEYLQKDISLPILSERFNTNTAYLSSIINTYKEKSFKTYLMDLRLETVVKKLKNEKRFRAYKIASIADEMGFKNVNTFTKVFRKKTGITPSYFIKQLNNQSEFIKHR